MGGGEGAGGKKEIMTFQLVFLALAQEDIIDAELHYGSISDNLADRFMGDLDHSIKLLHQYPLGFQLVRDGFRQVPLNNFPFVITY